MIRFTDAVCFLADVQTFEVMVVQQMITAVFKAVYSIQFKIAERAGAGLI